MSTGHDIPPLLPRSLRGTSFGSYIIEEKLASGGMAEIYRVHQEGKPNHPLALKCIRPDCDEDIEFRKMMMDEANIASLLEHPNISRVLETVQHEGQLGLILEYVPGLDLGRLRRLIKNKDMDFSLEVAIHVVREVLEGLDYAHNVKDERGEYLNVVHRDVSPGNVMITVDGRVVIVDFGIARAQNRLAKTEAGNVKGKFRYMAPEQIKGDPVVPATDVYSTAVLLWELLAGRRIYDELGVAQLMIHVANGQVPSLDESRKGLPRSLHAAFRRATTLSHEERYASARAFADALDEVLLEYDTIRCGQELRQMVLAASCRDSKRRLDWAMARARVAAEDDLEDAILSALEEPDRVERVEVDKDQVKRAEPPTGPLQMDANGEPPTAPMALPFKDMLSSLR